MIEPSSTTWQQTAKLDLMTARLPSNSIPHSLTSKRAHAISAQLKAIANKNRLVILFCLHEGEKSVSELCDILDMRQPAVSQNLARLRMDEIVGTRRVGKKIYYFIKDDNTLIVAKILRTLLAEPALSNKPF